LPTTGAVLLVSTGCASAGSDSVVHVPSGFPAPPVPPPLLLVPPPLLLVPPPLLLVPPPLLLEPPPVLLEPPPVPVDPPVPLDPPPLLELPPPAAPPSGAATVPEQDWSRNTAITTAGSCLEVMSEPHSRWFTPNSENAMCVGAAERVVASAGCASLSW
jgi:hypothetical protein